MLRYTRKHKPTLNKQVTTQKKKKKKEKKKRKKKD